MFHDAFGQGGEQPRHAARPADFIAWFLLLLVISIAAHKGY